MGNSAALETPQLDYDQAYKALRSIKRTVTGSEKIPYYIWKYFANILFPSCNESLEYVVGYVHVAWPSLWKTANINPIPKVDIPKIKKDFRGLNITPVIARAFERIVYGHFSKETFESGVNNNRFAYRKGGCAQR